MISLRSALALRRLVLCLVAALVMLPVWASPAAAATAPQNPPASMSAAHRQIAYWRTYALKERALHRLVARQRDFARVELRAERARHSTTTTNLAAYQDAVAGGIRALGGTDDLLAIIGSINAKLGGSGTTLARASMPAGTTVDTSERDALAAQIASANTELGGSGTLAARIAAVNGMLGGTGTTLTRAGDAANSSVALTTQITNASTDLGGTGTLAQRIADLGVTLGSTGSITTRAGAISAQLGGSGTTSARVTGVANNLQSTPSASLTTAVATLQAMVGGPASTLDGRINSVANSVLDTPTGDLRADVNTARSLLVNSPSVTMQSDIGSLMLRLDGVNTGSTLDSRIGEPLVNGITSSVADALGGSGSIADRIGDPVMASSGISGAIGSMGSSGNGFDSSSFDNATSIHAKVEAVASVFSQSNGLATNGIIIPRGTFATLADILATMDHD